MHPSLRRLSIVLLVIATAASWHIGRSSSNWQWWRVVIGLSSSRSGLQALNELVVPNSGEQVLAPAVRESLMLLRELHIRRYALSPRIEENEALLQRIVESAFPRRIEKTAPFMVMLPGELPPPRCRSLREAKHVRVASCN